MSFFGGADDDPIQVVVSSANYDEALKYGKQVRDKLALI